MEKRQILEKMRDAVVDKDVEGVIKVVKEGISIGIDPLDAIQRGLIQGMKIVGEKWGKGEFFLADVICAADSVNNGMKLLNEKIKESGREVPKKGSIVIGTVFGDIHSIGKDLLATMLKVSGFEIHDLGTDVHPMKFVEKAQDIKADIIAISCLLSPSLYYQRDVITYLKDMGIKDKIRVMIGGGAVTQDWVKEIGADGYANEAQHATEVAELLMEKDLGISLPIIK